MNRNRGSSSFEFKRIFQASAQHDTWMKRGKNIELNK